MEDTSVPGGCVPSCGAGKCVDDLLRALQSFNFWGGTTTEFEDGSALGFTSDPFIDVIFRGTGGVIDGVRLRSIDVLRPKLVSLLNVSFNVCIVFPRSPDEGGWWGEQ